MHSRYYLLEFLQFLPFFKDLYMVPFRCKLYCITSNRKKVIKLGNFCTEMWTTLDWSPYRKFLDTLLPYFLLEIILNQILTKKIRMEGAYCFFFLVSNARFFLTREQRAKNFWWKVWLFTKVSCCVRSALSIFFYASQKKQ